MNKVVTINLGGNAYQLEEGGYDALRAYLETAAARLQGNPDRDEILSDIEGAMAEKFRGLFSAQKNVVETREVTSILEAMGPVAADGDAGAGSTTATGQAGATGGQGTEAPSGSAPAAGRLYRIKEGSMIEGVCTGLAAYFGIADVTLIRLAFALSILAGGLGAIVYFIMAIVVPPAPPSAEKSAAAGFPATAAEFIRRAREGYYKATKNFPNQQARRDWKRQFKRELRAKRWCWHPGWAGAVPPSAPVHPGMEITLPILSLLQAATTIVWLGALISLLATGAVLGCALPASVPIWLAALLLMIGFGLVAGPLSAVRRSYYWGIGSARVGWSWAYWVDALIWLATVIVIISLAIHFLPELGAAARSLPSVAHEAGDNVKDWWNHK